MIAQSILWTFTEKTMNDTLTKGQGKGYPIGTVRTHGGVKVIKTAKGWVPHSDGSSVKNTKQKPKKSGSVKSQAKQIASIFRELSFMPDEMEDIDFASQLTVEDALDIVAAELEDGHLSTSDAAKLTLRLESIQDHI